MENKAVIRILPSAWNDLKTIEDYWLINAGGKSALKTVNSILDHIEQLSSFPDSGSKTPDAWLNDMGYRKLVCSRRYVCIYRHIDNTVFIYHIADTSTDYHHLFHR